MAAFSGASDPEESAVFTPKFDPAGLLTAVVTDVNNGELLMVAHMNAEALRHTVETGEAWFYSRSRQELWRKGATSGHVQKVVEMRVDCDQDAIWLKVEQTGAGACHTGRRSCFYRRLPLGANATAPLRLEFTDAERVFDADAVYAKKDR
jgi:phosphoribosyl-AMP cyclohydrolase